MGAGHAVGQAVRAAGVVGDVAADGAGRLAGRVGRVVNPVRSQGPAEVEVHHARLDPGHTVVEVYLQQPVHAGHRQHHRLAQRRRSAGQAGPGPPGRNRPPVARGDLDARHHVGGGAGIAHRSGVALLVDGGVAGGQVAGCRVGPHPIGPDGLDQVGDERGVGGVGGRAGNRSVASAAGSEHPAGGGSERPGHGSDHNAAPSGRATSAGRASSRSRRQ